MGFKRQKRFSAKAENRGVVVIEAGSNLRPIDFCTQLKAQGPSRYCNESKEEEGVALLVCGVGIRADGLLS